LNVSWYLFNGLIDYVDYLFFFTGGLAVWILILRRELLLRQNTFKLLLGISSVLFIIGIVCVISARSVEILPAAPFSLHWCH